MRSGAVCPGRKARPPLMAGGQKGGHGKHGQRNGVRATKNTKRGDSTPYPLPNARKEGAVDDGQKGRVVGWAIGDNGHWNIPDSGRWAIRDSGRWAIGVVDAGAYGTVDARPKVTVEPQQYRTGDAGLYGTVEQQWALGHRRQYTLGHRISERWTIGDSGLWVIWAQWTLGHTEQSTLR